MKKVPGYLTEEGRIFVDEEKAKESEKAYLFRAWYNANHSIKYKSARIPAETIQTWLNFYAEELLDFLPERNIRKEKKGD